MHTILYALYGIIHMAITAYIWIVIIHSFLSFVQPDPNNQIVQILRNLSEPPLAFIREKMPFVMVSGMDLSPIVLFFGLQFLDAIIRGLLIG